MSWMKLSIALNTRKEPTLKCLVLRMITPFGGLLDALISIFSFTLIESNFEFAITVKYAIAYHTYQKSKKTCVTHKSKNV